MIRKLPEADDLIVTHGQNGLVRYTIVNMLLLSDILGFLRNGCAFNPNSWHNAA